MKIFLNSLRDFDAAFPFWDAALYGPAPDANCDERPASSRPLALSIGHIPLHHALLTRARGPGFSSPISVAAGENTPNNVPLLSQTPVLYLGKRDDDGDDDKDDVLDNLRAIIARMVRLNRQSPDERFAHTYLRPVENPKTDLRSRLMAFQTALRTLTHSRVIDEFPASKESWNQLLNAWESWLFGKTMPRHLYLPTPARIARVQDTSFSAIFWGFTDKFLRVTQTRETLERKEWQELATRLLNLPWLCEAGFEKKFDAYFTLIKVLGADTPTRTDLASLAMDLDLDENATKRLYEAFFRRVPIETEADVDRVTTRLNGLSDAEKSKAYQNLQLNPHITPEAKTILARYVQSRYTRMTVDLLASSTSTEN